MTPPPGRDLTEFRNRLGRRNQLARLAWGVARVLLYRPSPRPCHGWRRWLLRRFGATVGVGAKPYPGAVVWAPWNLTLGDHAWLADGVDCYSVAPISIGAHAVVSQRAVLCAATHDYADPAFPLVARPITIADGAWVALEAFVGPGVSVGVGAVVGARACVTKSVGAGEVVAGNPARVIRRREPDAPIPPG